MNMTIGQLKAEGGLRAALFKDLSHFNDRVNAEIAAKIQTVAQLAKEDLISDLHRGEAYGCADVSDIYGYDPGGFIPFQDGGFMVTELYRNDIDTSYHLTEGQSAAVAASERSMYENFPDNLPEDIKAALPEEWGYDDLPEEYQSEFSDYENEWFEPALLRFCIFITKPENTIWDDEKPVKEHGVKIELSLTLNYTDAPYYREKYDNGTLATLGITIDEFMNLEPQDILSSFKERIKFD